MAVNQEAGTSHGKEYDILYNAPINAGQFLAGPGSNIKNSNKVSTPETIEAQDGQLQQDCLKIKVNLREKAQQNCLIDQVGFVADSGLSVKYVPLQMVQVDPVAEVREEEREINQILTEQPDKKLRPETFFETSRKFAESTTVYKNFSAVSNVTEEKKESLLNKLSNVVFVVGQAGMGKTCLTKKYLQLFLKNKVDSEFLFYIKFRDVDYEKESNLMTFLTGDDRYEDFDEKRLQHILEEISSNDNVTLVLDGMNESKLQIDEYSKADTDLHKRAKAQDFILGLLTGSILCKSKKLFTSRPKQLFDLPKRYQPQFIIKLLGIDQTSQKLICKNICGDDFAAVFKPIQLHSDLSNYCTVPLICIIIVYCLYKYLTFEQIVPGSLTEIFIVLICLYIKDPNHIRGELPLRNLCELAFYGILNQKLYFNQNDLRMFSLDKQDENNFTVTVQCFDRTDKLNFYSNATLQYTYFSHLIVQEWFAALYLMLYAETEEFNEVLFSKNCKINLRSINFDVFVKFLFGLSNESMFKKYCNHLPHRINENMYKQKLHLLKEYILSINNVNGVNDSIYFWLHELKDDKVTQQFADGLGNNFYINALDLLPKSIPVLNYILQCRRKNINLKVEFAFKPNLLKELGTSLKKNTCIKLEYLELRSLDDENISTSFLPLQKVEELDICYFSSEQVALKFSDAVIQREHPLKRLWLYFHGLNDETISAICSCLKNIEKINFGRFSSKQTALTLRDAVMQLEHPMKRLECRSCSADFKQYLLSCSANVEELIINGLTITESGTANDRVEAA